MRKSMAAVLLAMLVMLVTATCALGDVVFAFTNPEWEVSVGKSITIKPMLQGTEEPAKAKYVWSTSDKSIATVKNGKVSGKAAGTVTITCELTSGKETLYTATCEVTVLQPVKKIELETKKTIVLPLTPEKSSLVYSYPLQYTILPEDASNKEVVFRLNVEANSTVDAEKGIIYERFNSHKDIDNGGIVTLFIESTDGSGKYAVQTFNFQPFAVTVKTIEMTERGVYRLYIPTYVNDSASTGPMPNIALKGQSLIKNMEDHKAFGGGVWLENVQEGFFDWEIVPGKVNGSYQCWFDIRPVKAGTYTLKLEPSGWDDPVKYEIKLKVSESAAYGTKSFPKLNYKKAMQDPAALAGQPVTVTGKYIDRYMDEENRWCYVIATKGQRDDQITIRAPRDKDDIEYIQGDKVTVQGMFGEPLKKTNDAGLVWYEPVIDIEKIGFVCYNTDVYKIDMYEPEWEKEE